MNIIHAGKVHCCDVGDGISLDAQRVEELRRALNGGGPLTVLMGPAGLYAIHAHMPVPPREAPSNVIANPQADGVKCAECKGMGEIPVGADHMDHLIYQRCDYCHGSGQAKETP